ncbi:hypothetical protein PR048_003674 [Dryococelus australis]|uniref:Reverse transcriptase domain-containing protein n=1 Tax=Dryococelus australis TaxID=614101 RepID=A0ABQ9IPY3_9NEOP|nr:hypothetical protein PR048_003674 [Dryococelus australis]
MDPRGLKEESQYSYFKKELEECAIIRGLLHMCHCQKESWKTGKNNFGNDLAMCLMDVEKAYDRVKRSKLLEVLKEADMKEAMLVSAKCMGATKV